MRSGFCLACFFGSKLPPTVRWTFYPERNTRLCPNSQSKPPSGPSAADGTISLNSFPLTAGKITNMFHFRLEIVLPLYQIKLFIHCFMNYKGLYEVISYHRFLNGSCHSCRRRKCLALPESFSFLVYTLLDGWYSSSALPCTGA